MPGKGKKKIRAPSSDIALMIWLSGAPYLIMKVLDDKINNPTEVGKVLGKSVSWVSKRTGRMVELGLIVKDGPDDRGMVSMALTEKGKRVMDAITGITENPLFAELRRALDLKAPDDTRRMAVKNEAERLMRQLVDENDSPDVKPLYDAVLEALSMKVEGWYAIKDLTQLFATIGTERWDERSQLLLIKVIGMAISDSRNDREYVNAYNGLIEPLKCLASDRDNDVDSRVASIKAIASLRDRKGNVSDSAFMTILQVQWKVLEPGDMGSDLVVGAISEVLRKWVSSLSDAQKDMLLRSVGLMSYDVPPAQEHLFEGIVSGNPRETDRKMSDSYRSLVASLLDRDIPIIE